MNIIYKITCRLNQKVYIGVTKQNLKRRWYFHQWTAKTSDNPCYFHKAINKYGAENFVVEQIASCNDSDRMITEQQYIIEYNSYNSGYNSTPGGEDFTSSEYQKQLQLDRVASGTHPFLGGEIQRQSGLNREARGELEYLKEKTRNRVANGSHNFIGDNNPNRKRKLAGVPHYTQIAPWNNPSAAKSQYNWLIANDLYEWWVLRKDRPRKSGPLAMQREFDLTVKPTIITEKFKSGWVPLEDPMWIDTFVDTEQPVC